MGVKIIIFFLIILFSVKKIFIVLSVLANAAFFLLFVGYFYMHFFDYTITNDALTNRVPWLCQQMQSTSPLCNFIREKPVAPNESDIIVQYNCEQSGVSFDGKACTCPFEAQLGQTSESMYNKINGQCQTTAGGPGGNLGVTMNQCIGLRLALDECKKK